MRFGKLTMQPHRRDVHIVELLGGFLLLVLTGAVMWWLVGTKSSGPGENNSGQKTQGAAPAQLVASSSLATPSPSLGLAAMATQNDIATYVAFKQTDAVAAVIEMTTSPFPTAVPHPSEIITLQAPTLKLLPAEGVIAQNAWAGNINGRNLVVYVGALTAHLDEGGILVWSDKQHGGKRLFSVPGAHGVVKVTAETNLRLTLVSADNTIAYFDIPGLQFVSSLAEVVPTVDFSRLATPSAPAIVPIATSAANGYPMGLTTIPPATATSEPDWRATLIVEETRHPIPTSERPVGIFESAGDARLLKMGYNIQNSWQRLIDGHWVRVDVGGMQTDSTQGVVLLLREGVGVWTYTTPANTGPVKIISEHNYRLTLQSAQNTLFYFDVPGQRFASSLAETVPTITAQPTWTPTPLTIDTPVPAAAPTSYP